MDSPLRASLADYLGIEPAALGADFRFAGKDFQGSVGMYKFMAFAKRRLGRPVPVFPYGCTLAEAEALLDGKPAGPIDAGPEGDPARARPASPEAAETGPDREGTPPARAAREPSAPRAAAPPAPSPSHPAHGIGIDLEPVSSMPPADDFRVHPFYAESFTPAEIAYCALRPDPREALCGLFCAKEALLKADPACAGLALSALEIGHHPDGRPFYLRAGGRETPPFDLSLSHAGGLAVAVAVPRPLAPEPTPAPVPVPAAPPRTWRSRAVAACALLGLALGAMALILETAK